MKQIINILRNKTPEAVKKIVRFSGIAKIISHLIEYMEKKKEELTFQEQWAKDFKDNEKKVLEYWEKYRYLKEIKIITGVNENSRILDVGCGISTVLYFLEGKKYGIDPLANSYKKFHAYPEDINIQSSNGENIPFASKYFDAVFCSNVIDHVKDPQKTIDNIMSVLKTNGHLVLTCELFKKKTKRDAAHPHSLMKTDILGFCAKDTRIVFEKESPWIGMQEYVKRGEREKQYKHNELIIIFQKVV